MADPPLHLRARGFLKSWASGAMLWSHATRQLIAVTDLGVVYLAMVALFLCLESACLLIDGRATRRSVIPADDDALADCPLDARELHALRDRIERFRDEVMHFYDRTQEGRALNASWTANPPGLVIKCSVGDRGTLEWDSISRAEVLELLDKLDLWLHRHWEHLVHEDDTGG